MLVSSLVTTLVVRFFVGDRLQWLLSSYKVLTIEHTAEQIPDTVGESNLV